MKNFVSEGQIVDMTLGFDVTGGMGYTVADIVVVATRDAKAGTRGSFLTMGVVRMPKVLLESMSAGQAVYWNNSTKRLTTQNAGNKKFGFTVEPAAVGDSDVLAYLYALS